MKRKMRDHIHSCGQVLGFLSHYHILSKGEAGKSAEEVFTDYCLEWGGVKVTVTSRKVEPEERREPSSDLCIGK